MIVVLFFLFILTIILSYLFFAPFYLEINSTNGFLRFRFHRIASMNLSFAEGTLMLELKILGWTKKTDLLQSGKSQGGKVARKKKLIQNNKRVFDIKKLRGLLLSFKVTKCKISIDTGDEMLNGILYPVFYLSGCRLKKDIQINFVNENVILFEVSNSIARMARAYIKA